MPHPSYRFGPARRRDKLEPLQPPLRERKARLREDVGRMPLFEGELTIVSETRGLVLAIDARHKVAWTYPLAAPFDATITFSGAAAWTNDRLYLDDDGQLVVLDARNGGTIVRPPVREPDILNGAAIGGALIARFKQDAGGYRVGRFDPDLSWSVPTDEPLATLSAGEDVCVYQPDDGSIAALALDSGREIWRAPIEGMLVSPPIIWESAVFLGMRPELLVALDLKTGAERWRRKIEIENPANLTLDPAGLLELCEHPLHLTLDARTGEETRRHDFSSALRDFGISLVLHMDLSRTHLWAADSYGSAFAMNRRTGRIDWVQDFGARFPAAHYPLVRQGSLLVLDGANRLHIFEKDT